jgi:thiamine pyrophosphate-dependent acetolactate synthase large subunit-like protein
MPHWKSRIKLSHFYHADIPICDKAKRVARELMRFAKRQESLPPERQLDYQSAEDLAFDFEMLSKDEYTTADDFDVFMSELYDWADVERVWIDTISHKK